MPADHLSTPLPPAVREFLDAPRFAVLATVNEDGSPHQAVAWYLLEGDTIVVNSREGRRWPANLRRDPRASVSVVSAEDGYTYVTVSGEVEIDDDPERAQADIAAMARLYHADDPAGAEEMIERQFRRQHRVSFRLRPAKVYEHFE